jgi:AraC-like DNA-binding protein
MDELTSPCGEPAGLHWADGRIPFGEPLRRYPLFRTASPEEARAALGRCSDIRTFELPRGREGFFGQVNYCRFKGLDLAFTEYASEVEIRFGARGQVRQQFCLSGRSWSATRGSEVEVDGHRSCIISPDAEVKTRFDPGYRQILLRLDSDRVAAKLEALVGARLKGRLDFSPETDAGDPHQRRLLRLILFIVAELDSAGAKMSDTASSELEQTAIVFFLLGSEHNYRHLLDGNPAALAPWQVRRAEEYIEANWDKPITIEALSVAVNAGARNLFRTFRQNRGCSPMVFAKRVRLAHARDMLRGGADGATVTDIALACGFQNLGRFANDYRQVFGETPSQTLGRAKGAWGHSARRAALGLGRAGIAIQLTSFRERPQRRGSMRGSRGDAR